jgi:DNA-binding PadR family transcriptional regulator
VREQSLGRVPLQTGSLYRHLSRLIEGGLVTEGPARRPVEDVRRGTHYRITLRGRQALERERRYFLELTAALGGLRPALRRDAP